MAEPEPSLAGLHARCGMIWLPEQPGDLLAMGPGRVLSTLEQHPRWWGVWIRPEDIRRVYPYPTGGTGLYLDPPADIVYSHLEPDVVLDVIGQAWAQRRGDAP